MATDRDAQGRFLPNNRSSAVPLSLQVVVVSDAIQQVTESVVKALTLDILANLRRDPGEGGTPVDTGWARANWLPSLASPVNSPAGEPTPSGVLTAGAAQQAGVGAVLGYKLPSGPVYVTNNVSYITRLNDGSSKQAPAGFVQKAIQEAITGLTRLGR